MKELITIMTDGQIKAHQPMSIGQFIRIMRDAIAAIEAMPMPLPPEEPNDEEPIDIQ